VIRPELDATQTAPAKPARDGGEMAAGFRLDHYRIEKKLGAGGMGEVYLATDLALDRPVAIKVLPAGSSSGSARDRLIREARAQARVQHANVAHIYFIGEDQGRLYFAMEYVEGETLADKLSAGPLTVDAALAAIHSAVLGLREAQTHGFTHRDVKPSNLMVDKRGTLKVVDFGLVAGGGAAQGSGPVQQTTLAGTPLYMAPEQARGEPIDLRADIYALGATLYHLVAGKPPFVAESVEALATLHRSAERPAVVRKGVPRTQLAAIDSLVTRMMATDASDRFASYDELLRAIELASAQHTRPAGVFVRACANAADVILVAIVLGLTRNLVYEFGAHVPFLDLVVPVLALVQLLAMARWRTTPGKALFELEVVQIGSGSRWRAAALRIFVLYAGVVVVAAIDIAQAVTDTVAGNVVVVILEVALRAVAYGWPFVALIHAAMRVPGKRPPWDRVAGTIVRYRTGRATMS
jgi:hypothetical protein